MARTVYHYAAVLCPVSGTRGFYKNSVRRVIDDAPCTSPTCNHYRTMLAEPNYSSKKFKSSNSNFSVQHSCILATCDILPPSPLDINHLEHAHWLRLIKLSTNASRGLGASNLVQRRHIERQHILILQFVVHVSKMPF